MNVDPLEAIEERIRATFARLSSLGPLEQETILTDISAADPDVSRAVARLLGLSAPPAFAAGDLISDRFRIVGLLGRGGMGEVYEADDAVLRERVALKTLPAEVATDARAVERLKREIALARRVTHPNVCRVFDVDQDRAPSGAIVTFFTMELLAGPTLSERLKARGRMTAAEALPLLRRMADGLGAAHAAGVVHGDFKPGNVMLAATAGSSERLVVTDFGLALPAHPASLGALAVPVGAGGGTPMYMAPEQIARHPLTPQTDVYALGVVAKEMVAGELDTRWRAAIARCLEHEPSARFATAADFVDALEPLEATTPVRGSRGAWIGVTAALLVVAVSVPFVRNRFRGDTVQRTAAPTAARQVALVPAVSARDSELDRGLLVALSEQLHLASVLQPDGARLRVVPAAEVGSVDATHPAGIRRVLGVNIIVTVAASGIDGTSNGDITIVVDDDRPAGSATRRVRVSHDQGMLPSAIAGLTEALGLTIFPSTLKRMAEGGTVSPTAEAFYLRGRANLARGASGLDSAIEWLGRARKDDPQFALAAAALAEGYRLKYAASRDAKFVELAQRTSDDAIRLNGNVAYTHVVRGSVFRDTGQHARAIAELETALQIDPRALNAHRRLAEAYEAEEDSARAEQSYRAEIAAYPEYWSGYVDLGSYLIRRGRYRDAEASLLQGVRYAPDNDRAIGNLAGLYILTERFAAAEAELTRGLSIAPSVIGLNNLAWVHIYQGQLALALPLLERAVALPGADSTHWGNLARVYRWSGRSEQARATYDSAIRRAAREVDVNPRDVRIRANLASLWAEIGHRREALTEISSSLERGPKDLSALFRSAVVHELTGDRKAALAAVEAAARGGYSPVEIRRYPDLARLREDPGYLAILRVAPTLSR
jgi:tetratricopeptide (TPR) repeat protein/tRNA A-37 threonylcarbamoyl transferase component Bud32